MSNHHKVLAVIPARYYSTRLAAKPLLQIGSFAMIHHVYNQVSKSDLVDQVIIATDDHRIVDYCTTNQLLVMNTSNTHESGTDRIAEVAQAYLDYSVILNVQGDEPLIDPNQINELIRSFSQGNADIATQCSEITDIDELHNFNKVKVIRNKSNQAIYFSRQAIPAQRDQPFRDWLTYAKYYKHIGIYIFKSRVLKEIVQLPMSQLEKAESLEQLRWLENGYNIEVYQTAYESQGVDTPEDLEKVRNIWANGKI